MPSDVAVLHQGCRTARALQLGAERGAQYPVRPSVLNALSSGAQGFKNFLVFREAVSGGLIAQLEGF
jgi:hypothetical protein